MLCALKMQDWVFTLKGPNYHETSIIATLPVKSRLKHYIDSWY
jgi:hypothetical protein